MTRSVVGVLIALISIMCGSVGADRRPASWVTAVDFAARLGGEGVVNSSHAEAASRAVGGVTKPGIFQHPNGVGQPPARLEFRSVALPTTSGKERLLLHFFVGISDGFSIRANPGFDGCRFIVEVNGKEVFMQDWAEQRWSEHSIDLTSYAGQTVAFAFVTDPRERSDNDWAVWGTPQVLIEGRRARVKEISRIPMLGISALRNDHPASRVVERHEDPRSCTVVTVMDRDLDLAAQLKDYAPKVGSPAIPTAPEMVVGEGADPGNHTIVKVLNRYGIADVQFLAYGPEVRGGVTVCAGPVLGREPVIVTCPISDTATREVRLFNRSGGLVGSFTPGHGIAPPYMVAVGRFLEGHSAQIAVAGSSRPAGNGHVGIYNGKGALLRSLTLPQSGGAVISTMPGERRDQLVVFQTSSKTVFTIDPISGQITERRAKLPASTSAVYASSSDPGSLVAVAPDESVSSLTYIQESGETRTVDAGRSENRFWIQWYAPDWAQMQDGKYVRRSTFRHLRTDGASPGLTNPNCGDDPDLWAGEKLLKSFDRLFANYDTDMPALWEPCFTHRQPKGAFKPWRATIDKGTGLPRYMMLTRNNNPAEYGEFNTSGFDTSTYAFGIPEIDHLYVLPLRAFLRRLAVSFHKNPEHAAGLEPNHEHEIAVGAEGTMGDYNPYMIQGFYRYLAAQYGEDLPALNGSMGTPFGGYFDAPRAWGRGDWDDYSGRNPFFMEWVAYNRYVVNRRLAQTFREALLAGFPPEFVKCHQIPDTYAIGNLSAFSTATSRFTPIDYALNTGIGYGFTRYGVWYNAKHDALQDAHSAGFDSMSIGEYQALTPDNEAAYNQLKFLENNGCTSVHCMKWPDGYDRGYNASMDDAIRRVLAEDDPRPGITGGVGEVKPVPGRFDIACIGTGPDHTGLLKSIKPDGSWEGSVYVVPFHSHVDIQPIGAHGTIGRDSREFSVGPLAGLDSGSQIEITFRARSSSPNGTLVFRVLRGGQELPGLSQEVSVTPCWKEYRYVLRVQLPVDGITISAAAMSPEVQVEARDVTACRHTEMTPKLSKGILTGVRHKGGVTFDILGSPASAH